MKKPFKETALGQWMKDKNLLGGLGDILPSKGLLGVAKNIIGSSSLSKQEKQEGLKIQQREYEIFVQDTQDARSNETKRDTNVNSSWMSKNQHEIISFVLIGGWVVSWWVEVGIDKQDIKDAVYLVLGYLYGRSQPQK